MAEKSSKISEYAGRHQLLGAASVMKLISDKNVIVMWHKSLKEEFPGYETKMILRFWLNKHGFAGLLREALVNIIQCYWQSEEHSAALSNGDKKCFKDILAFQTLSQMKVLTPRASSIWLPGPEFPKLASLEEVESILEDIDAEYAALAYTMSRSDE